MVEITSVTYRALRSGRGFSNSAVEATAIVPEGSDPSAVLAQLRQFVDAEVDENLKRTDAYETLSDINLRIIDAKSELERTEKRANAYRSLLKERTKLADLARANGLGGDALILETI